MNHQILKYLSKELFHKFNFSFNSFTLSSLRLRSYAKGAEIKTE